MPKPLYLTAEQKAVALQALESYTSDINHMVSLRKYAKDKARTLSLKRLQVVAQQIHAMIQSN